MCIRDRDVTSGERALAMREQTGCDGVMIGRGAQGNPWIFRELVEYERTGALPPRPSKQEIKDTMLRHARLQIEFKGNYLGIREMRKHVAWYTCLLYTSLGFSDKELFMGMLEAAAKLLHIPKYQIYTVDELYDIVYKKYETLRDQMNLPRFVHVLIGVREGRKMDLKGRNFLTLKDFTPEEITYLLDLAADLKEKKKNGVLVDHYRCV